MRAKVRFARHGVFSSPRRSGAALLAALVGFTPTTLAANKSWIGVSGSWSVSSNWGPVAGQPLDGDIVLLRQSDSVSRIITFDAAATTGTIAQLILDATGTGSIGLVIPSTSKQTISLIGPGVVGDNGQGFVQQDGGTQTIASTLLLGSSITGIGTFQLTGGSLSALNESLGDIGKGTFTQSGGSHLVNGTLAADGMSLGGFAGSGTYSLSIGSLIVSAPAGVRVGGAGNGAFTQISGTLSTSSGVSLVIGTGTSSSSGRYTMIGGTLSVLGDEDIAHSGIGSLSQTGGVNNVGTTSSPRSLFVGNNAGSVGTYSLSGTGSLNVFGSELIGASGAGTFSQSAGGHAVGSIFSGGMLAVGYFPGGSGNFILSGTGSLNIIGEERLGSSGFGTFTHSAGTHTVGTASTPSVLSLGYAGGSAGTYLLGGSGLLNVNGIEYVGADGAGTFNQTGGTHAIGSGTSAGALYIGFGAGTGTYLLGPSGTLTMNGSEYVGYASAGTFSQSGGVHTVGSISAPGTLLLGVASGSSGIYQINGSASISVVGQEVIGFSGNGTINQSAGNHAVGAALAPGELNIALNPGSNGTYLLSSTGSLMVIGQETIGVSGNGTFIQTGGAHALGTASAPSDLSIGNQFGSNGTYLQSGTASLVVIGDEFIGDDGNGTFNQSGGIHTLGTGPVARNRYIGEASGSSGQYVLSGTGVTSITGTQYIGDSGFGTFDQSGGTQTVGTPAVPGAMRIGVNAGSAGTYLLSGTGVLTVNGDESLGESGTATFSQSGGTHTIGSVSTPARLLLGNGTYSLSGTSALSVFGDEIVGAAPAAARFTQSSGAHAIGAGSIIANLYVGAVGGSTASFTLSGGTLSISGDETVGASGNGTLTQNAGTHLIGSILAPRSLYIGRFSGGNGTVQLSGAGSLTLNGNAFVGGGASSAGGMGVLDVGARASISGVLTAWGTAGTSVKVSGGTLSAVAVMNDALFTQTAGSANVGNFDSVTAGAGTVALSGGTLTANRLRQGTVSLSGSARLKLNPNGGDSATSVVSTLDITSPAQLDLNNNDLIVDYAGANPTANLRQMLADKRIASSAATPLLGLGYAESTSLFSAFPSLFSGQSVDATSVLIKFTFLGDANLDGQVNTADLTSLAIHWQQTGQPWGNGDFNYDGAVDVSDLYLLATNWKAGAGAPLGSPMSAADLGALFNLSVPEPGAISLLYAAGTILARRRRAGSFNSSRFRRRRNA